MVFVGKFIKIVIIYNNISVLSKNLLVLIIKTHTYCTEENRYKIT